ncbi:hypothetical protein FOL47_008207 [Perkinsus chesapeaki]|uniref:Uncharacterized protein n=1 Tax=Perkinsus chesapeaki TaxID=330153 RepID=A0A7J6LFK4_PERCH|nr:hypothetical protein FOL47_008207 [Perkinsus chesapeaki]
MSCSLTESQGRQQVIPLDPSMRRLRPELEIEIPPPTAGGNSRDTASSSIPLPRSPDEYYTIFVEEADFADQRLCGWRKVTDVSRVPGQNPEDRHYFYMPKTLEALWDLTSLLQGGGLHDLLVARSWSIHYVTPQDAVECRKDPYWCIEICSDSQLSGSEVGIQLRTGDLLVVCEPSAANRVVRILYIDNEGVTRLGWIATQTLDGRLLIQPLGQPPLYEEYTRLICDEGCLIKPKSRLTVHSDVNLASSVEGYVYPGQEYGLSAIVGANARLASHEAWLQLVDKWSVFNVRRVVKLVDEHDIAREKGLLAIAAQAGDPAEVPTRLMILDGTPPDGQSRKSPQHKSLREPVSYIDLLRLLRSQTVGADWRQCVDALWHRVYFRNQWVNQAQFSLHELLHHNIWKLCAFCSPTGLKGTLFSNPEPDSARLRSIEPNELVVAEAFVHMASGLWVRVLIPPDDVKPCRLEDAQLRKVMHPVVITETVLETVVDPLRYEPCQHGWILLAPGDPFLDPLPHILERSSNTENENRSLFRVTTPVGSIGWNRDIEKTLDIPPYECHDSVLVRKESSLLSPVVGKLNHGDIVRVTHIDGTRVRIVVAQRQARSLPGTKPSKKAPSVGEELTGWTMLLTPQGRPLFLRHEEPRELSPGSAVVKSTDEPSSPLRGKQTRRPYDGPPERIPRSAFTASSVSSDSTSTRSTGSTWSTSTTATSVDWRSWLSERCEGNKVTDWVEAKDPVWGNIYYINRWTKEMQLMRPRVPLPSALCRFVLYGIDFNGMATDSTLGLNVVGGLRRLVLAKLPEEEVMSAKVWIEGLEDMGNDRRKSAQACQCTIRIRAKRLRGGELGRLLDDLVRSDNFQHDVVDMLYNIPNSVKMLPHYDNVSRLRWDGLETWTDETYPDSPDEEGYIPNLNGSDDSISLNKVRTLSGYNRQYKSRPTSTIGNQNVFDCDGDIGDTPIIALCSSSRLGTCPIIELNLWKAGLSDVGVASLADAIGNNNLKNLHILNLEDNFLTPTGCKALFKSLRRCLLLEELFIGSNVLEDSLVEFADALCHLRELTILGMSRASLQFNYGFVQLVDRLVESDALRTVYIADNDAIGLRGVEEMLQRLVHNQPKSCLFVDMRHCCEDSPIVAAQYDLEISSEGMLSINGNIMLL